MNKNNQNRKFNLNAVCCTQYISAEELELQRNNALNGIGLSFLHVNIRSLSKNKSFLEEIMSLFNIFQDIIGICETKLNTNSKIDLISLKNYNLHFVNSETRSGGALVYIKNQFYIQ